MLCGVLAVHPRHADLAARLREERMFLGSVMGSFEGWLGVRSLRTLELRVERQSLSCERLVAWLAAADGGADRDVVTAVVAEVRHASLQALALDRELGLSQNGGGGAGATVGEAEGTNKARNWLRRQMPRGFGPVFALMMRSERAAKRLPSKLALFHHATSLGGVESLVEWRCMTDSTCDRRLVRVSVGLEAWEDLRDDLRRAFVELAHEGV